MNAFLNLNKPAGITSHDAVARVRRLAGRGVKVGHAGTLDPAATGVLPIALGYATRLIEYMTDARKGYRAIVRLGITTTTDDAEGEVIEERAVPAFDEVTLERALKPLRGTIYQVPPMYSALHHNGKRLYELARAGETVERAARQVTISDLRSTIFDLHTIVLDIECSKGTYIRSLARDLGDALGCGAHVAGLKRTFVGSLALEQATSLAELEADASLMARVLLPPDIAVADWPMVTLDAAQTLNVRNGRALPLDGLIGDYARAHRSDGTLLALLHHVDNEWRPEKVFV